MTLVPPIWFFFLQPVHHALGSFFALTLPQNWVTLIPDVLATMTRPHELVLALCATGLTERAACREP